MRVVETQKRGAVHFHVPLRSSVLLDVLLVQEMAVAAGLGCVIDLKLVKGRAGIANVAHYVAKYVSKACGDRDEIPWLGEVLDVETGELVTQDVRATYRTWSASRGWFVSMAAMRATMRDQARRRAAHLLGLAEPDGLVLDVDLGSQPAVFQDEP